MQIVSRVTSKFSDFEFKVVMEDSAEVSRSSISIISNVNSSFVSSVSVIRSSSTEEDDDRVVTEASKASNFSILKKL